ncbi:uncharacterized protein LOC116259931 isoform X2 [Nymphaea colorata]|uniref:uncharacterized protein LOC116259931 isoform X2 n=1 Tax=Nymphaea colorata TaxID=210225 RepID=UPI00129DC2B9|nr:uncharacterized protein LOC116259931 isoform X2 [Nymphaea colorata]
MSNGNKTVDVLDGSKITDLVHNGEVFDKFVDHKFEELDQNHDGKLSVKELVPAIAEIGAAMGLPAQGSSPDSDKIYSEVLMEFTRGKKEGKVSKSQFKTVLSDILLGMADGLKRDPVVILRIDGEDLQEFVSGSRFEAEAISIYSEIEEAKDLKECICKALDKLTVEHGMPPSSDQWVRSNVVEPALEFIDNQGTEAIVSQTNFLEAFRKVLDNVVVRLREHPVIVAHSGNTFDGRGIKRILSNKSELEKTLDSAWKSLPKDHHGKLPREYLRVALDVIAPAISLPPYGAVDQMDAITGEVFKMVKAEEGSTLNQEEFNQLMLEIISSIMLQLEGNPVTVSSNAVVNEPLNSTLLSPPE